MKKLILVLLFPLLSFSQPKDSIQVRDSIEVIANLKKLDNKQNQLKKAMNESKKIDNETHFLLKRLISYYKKWRAQKQNNETSLSDIRAVKPEQYEPIEEIKEHTEQKPRSGIIRWLQNLFSKSKDTVQ